MQFDAVQKLGKDNLEAVMKSVGVVSKGAQMAAVDLADYAKRSFEQGGATVEQLAGARTFDTAMQIQGEYLRSAYESFVSQAARMGELLTDTAKDAFAPMEGLVARGHRAA